MTKINFLFFLILFPLVLTGCETRKGPPAPVSYGHSLPSSSSLSPSPLSTSELLAPEPLKPQKIIVGNYETLAMVAKRTGVPAHQVIILNNLKRPYVLKPGQELRLSEDIPLKESVIVEDQSATESDLNDTNDDSSSTAHILPKAKPKRKLTEAEQELIVSLQQEKQAMSQKKDIKKQELSDKESTSLEDPLPKTPSLSDPQPEVSSRQEESLPLNPKKTSLKTSQFTWPVKGKIISHFGPVQGTLQNDGINIAAPEGTPIMAIEEGLVVYAGNEMQAFGNLILLKHPSGWISSYGHAAKLLVERGTQVQKGQTIALVGRTGSVDKPQLHFELRDLTKNGKVVNPELYLE